MDRKENFELGNKMSIFKSGIKPIYEDERNKHGGKFILGFPVNEYDKAKNHFVILLLNMILGYFASPSNIVFLFSFLFLFLFIYIFSFLFSWVRVVL